MDNRIEIMQGVHLTAVQTDKFKTGCLSINFLRPMCHEEASANALIPNILLRGSRNYPDITSISARLDELYGATLGTLIRKKGEVQMIGFYIDCIEDELAGEAVFEPLVEFMAELLLDPLTHDGAFSEPIFQSEKRNLQNAIASNINDKRSYAIRRLLAVMCEGEAYGIARLGDMEDIEAYDARSLYAHYQKVLATSQVEIFYMGRKSAKQVADCLARVLAPMPREDIAPTGTQVIGKAGQVKEHEQVMDVTQGKLAMGFRTGCTACDAEYPALVMCNTIFGAGMTSKLFTQVREKMSLCYYASSMLEKFKGVMLVSSGIEFANFQTAKTEILHQLELCRQGEISDYELESARRYILSDLRSGMDSPGRLDDYSIGQIVLGQDSTMQDFASKIEAVTREDVIEAAKRITLDTVFFIKGEDA